MYTDTASTTSSAYDSDSMESKYTVADILSSMANGEPPLPYSQASVSGVTTTAVSTPILTPTTLANLEQSFIELTNATQSSLVGHHQPVGIDRESGFVPPVVHPPTVVKQECSEYYSTEDGSDSEWSPPGTKRMKMTVAGQTTSQPLIRPLYTLPVTAAANSTPTRKSTRRIKDDMLSSEELKKRQVRRERNKMAAAKCRQRRVDLTNKLITETEGLEDEQSSLENEIQNLQQQKEQLEFLLQAHQPVCTARKGGLKVPVVVKKEDHAASTSTAISGAGVSGTGARPTTLSIPRTAHLTTTVSSTLATGVAISTPSSGSFMLGLDSMMDGHTGLTPITGAPTCGSQVQRSSSDSSPGEGLNSPTRLLAL